MCNKLWNYVQIGYIKGRLLFNYLNVILCEYMNDSLLSFGFPPHPVDSFKACTVQRKNRQCFSEKKWVTSCL